MTYWTKADAINVIRDLIDEAWEVETPDQAAVYPEYCDVKNFSRGEFVDIQIGGLGTPLERATLEDIDYDTYVIGPELRVIPVNYGRGFRIAQEDLDDISDSGPWDGANAAKMGQYSDVMKRWKRSCTIKVENIMADKILKGTTAGAYAGRDGLALLSASHVTLKNPPQTQSNVTTAASLTQANIYSAVTALDTQFDDRGDYIDQSGGYILLYGPAKNAAALEILKTERQLDTHNWNKNLLTESGKNGFGSGAIKPVQCKYLGATYTGWWLISKERNPLVWRWRQKPKYDQNVDFDANALKYKVTMRGATYHRDWRGIAGYPTS
jgi:hypothetical protein